MEEIIKYIELKIDPDFNYDVEYWDSGNFDDAYSYGVEVGEQYAYKDILKKLKQYNELH